MDKSSCKMMKTIIIFGATGGIGAYTALHLHESKKYKVIAVGNRKSDNGVDSRIRQKISQKLKLQ